MALSRMVKGTMNIKRIVALSAATAILAGGNAFAATTKTGTVTVKWNTQLTATLTLVTDYNASGAFNGATQAGQILAQVNSGAGACTAVDPTNTNQTVDFGAVTPDGGTAYTDCLYKNAVDAQVTTNSTNWNLKAAATAGYTAANGTLCAYTNGTVPTASATTTARSAAVTVTAAGTCTGGFLLDGTGSTLATSTSAASNAHVGMDLELVLPPNAPSGPQTVTETYTLTAN